MSEALADLMDTLGSRVHRRVLGIVRDEHDAQEVVQDVWVKVWRTQSGFRGDAALSTWIYRIATNAALSRMRHRNRTRQLQTSPLEGHDRPTGAPSPEAVLLLREQARRVALAVSKLPRTQRDALICVDVHGAKTRAVAEAQRLSVNTVKTRLWRARQYVQRELAS